MSVQKRGILEKVGIPKRIKSSPDGSGALRGRFRLGNDGLFCQPLALAGFNFSELQNCFRLRGVADVKPVNRIGATDPSHGKALDGLVLFAFQDDAACRFHTLELTGETFPIVGCLASFRFYYCIFHRAHSPFLGYLSHQHFGFYFVD